MNAGRSGDESFADDTGRPAPASEPRARGEQFMARFLERAHTSHDLIAALQSVLAPDARVHLQNGEVVGTDRSTDHARFAQDGFPDMELEILDTWFPDDRVVARIRVYGTARAKFFFIRAGMKYDVGGAFIARIRPDLQASEVWSYVNPGLPFTFPPRGLNRRPPPADAAGEDAARALYERWMEQAEAGDDFVRSITMSMAPDGVVHVNNGDTGGRDALVDLFRRLNRGLHDLSIEIEDVMFDGPRLAAPFRMSGVHRGRIGLFLPSGKVLPSTGAVLARANEHGQAAEVWIYVAPAYAVTFPPGGSPRA